MNQYIKPEMEYTLDSHSAKMYPQWDHSRVITPNSWDLEAAKLRQLYEVCTLLVDISERIRDSVRELEQSERELQ